MTNSEKRINDMGKVKTSELSMLQCLDILAEEGTVLSSILDELELDALDSDLLDRLQEEIFYGIN